MWTIWGRADQQRQLAPGIWEVSTPSHGGLVFTSEAAEQLSHACLKHGERAGGYVFFEEDVDYMFPLFEMPWLESGQTNEIAETVRQRYIELIRRWDPEYLASRGVMPGADEEGAA